MTSQLRRAVTSIPLNIAEGYGKRSSTAEFKRFLQMAQGSVNETKVLITMSHDLGFMSEKDKNGYLKEADEIGAMLYALSSNWQRKA